MDRIEICKKCRAEIVMKFSKFCGSCTETESYDCPNCGKHLFSSRDSGYYHDLKIVKKENKDKEKC